MELAGLSARGTAAPAGDEYLRAAFFAAYNLDPGAGTSRVMMMAGGQGEQDAEPASAPEDVARLLDAVPLNQFEAGVLVDALAAAVDNARYWQEPDGEDVLAATPVMCEALSRVAASVTTSGLPAWWVTPLGAAPQWGVTFDDQTRASTAVAQTANAALSSWRANTVQEETQAQRERPADPRAAWSGTWWSTPPHDLTRTTRDLGTLGPVGLRLVEDSFNGDRATVRSVTLPANANANVYEVDGPEAWSNLCRRFPLEVTASRRHDWYRTTGLAGRWVIPDWSRAANELDAVHLTPAGYLTTAGRPVTVTEGTSTVLAGWNPDATYWLTDVENAPETERRWRRGDDGTWSEDVP